LRRKIGQTSPVSWQANAVRKSTVSGVPTIAARIAGSKFDLNHRTSAALGIGTLHEY
jgi:hypothetical protein